MVRDTLKILKPWNKYCKIFKVHLTRVKLDHSSSLKQKIWKVVWNALRNLALFVQFKDVKNTHGGVLVLVKLQLLQVTLLDGCFWRFLCCTNGTKLCKTSHIILLLTERRLDITVIHNGQNEIHDFFISFTFISNSRLKLAKHQVNAKKHLAAELLLFKNYSYSSSTLSSKNNRTYSEK